MLTKKTSESDISRLADQPRPAMSSAQTLASVEGPARALEGPNKKFASSNELMKSLDGATEIARRLTQRTDLPASASQELSKVDLHLPNVSSTIKASLPRHLADISARPTLHAPVGSAEINRETSSQEDVPLDSAKDLGRFVRRLRERRKLSQQEFADLAGVGRRFLSELENGKPTLEFEKVVKVARAAGISLFARDRSR